MADPYIITQTAEELQNILDNSVSGLKAVSIAQNCELSQVIDSTNTTTVLDDVLYIYDASQQVTYGMPALTTIGETIVSVSGGVLTTSDGVEYGLNEFVDDNSYNFQPSQAASPKVFQPQKSMFAFHYDGPYITNFTDLLDKADELGVPVCIGAIKNLTNGASGGQNENPLYGYVTDYIDAQ